MKLCLMFFIFLTVVLNAAGQQDSIIQVSGKVFDPAKSNPDLTNFMVVGMESQRGIYGKGDGTFMIDLPKHDTLVVAVVGYEFVKYCFRDSVPKPSYEISVRLRPKQIRLPEVRIIAPRDLEAIERDIRKLGYNKKDYEISGINAMESPITFLYEEFSRFQRLRRHNAQLVNEDKRRNLLKELLARYVADDIIKLSNEHFDQFVDFCNVSEHFMKTSSQYDFMVYIKNRFELFEAMNDYYRPVRKMR